MGLHQKCVDREVANAKADPISGLCICVHLNQTDVSSNKITIKIVICTSYGLKECIFFKFLGVSNNISYFITIK